MRTIIAALVFCFLALPALAQYPTRVHVVMVQGPDMLPSSFLPVTWDAAREHLYRAGVLAKATRFTAMYDVAPQLMTLSTRKAHLYAWQKYGRRNKFDKKVDQIHIITPPIAEGGFNWFAGMAYGFCQSGAKAISISTAGIDISGNIRVTHSAIGIAHEMAHILGAKHTDTNDLMNTQALELVKTIYPLPVVASTLKEITKCQRRKKAGKRAAKKAASF